MEPEAEEEATALPLERAAAAMLLAALPLSIAVAVLQLLGPLGRPVTDHELGLLGQIAVRRAFVGGVITYCAAVVVHISVCLLATVVFLHTLVRDHRAARWIVLALMLVMAAGAIGGIYGLASTDWRAYRLTNSNYRDLYAATGAGAFFLGEAVYGWTRLEIAVGLPTALGIAAVVAAAGAAQVLSLGLPAEPRVLEPTLRMRQEQLRQLLYLLSIVLVTSTAAASLFFHLPTHLFEGPAAAGREVARLAAYAGELSMFWGAVFTLTLMATFVPPLLRLQRAAIAVVDASPPEAREKLREALLAEGALATPAAQVRLLFALLAPLLSGPAANLLQSWSGS